MYHSFIFYLCTAEKISFMFVSCLVEKEFSEALGAEATAQSARRVVRKPVPQKKTANTSKSAVKSTLKNSAKNTTKTVIKGKQLKKQLKKEVSQKRSYSEEPITRDATWNIYTGNPGIYITGGDTANFGNVAAISDSTFINAPRIIVPKTIKPYGIVGKELIIPNQDWVLGIILIFWMIFASVRVGFLKYLGQIFVSLVNLRAANRLYQQSGYKTMFGAVRLDIIFHLILPLSIFQIASYFKIDIPGYPAILLYLAILLIINGYLYTKILLFRMAGSIVMLKEQTEETVFNTRLYYKALGLVLLPIVTIHAILSETNFITILVMAGLIIIMYIATVIRTIYLGNRKDISFFYLILYLCTLEILPLLLVFKLISAQ
jgi:hypothetical protein